MTLTLLCFWYHLVIFTDYSTTRGAVCPNTATASGATVATSPCAPWSACLSASQTAPTRGAPASRFNPVPSLGWTSFSCAVRTSGYENFWYVRLLLGLAFLITLFHFSSEYYHIVFHFHARPRLRRASWATSRRRSWTRCARSTLASCACWPATTTASSSAGCALPCRCSGASMSVVASCVCVSTSLRFHSHDAFVFTFQLICFYLSALLSQRHGRCELCEAAQQGVHAGLRSGQHHLREGHAQRDGVHRAARICLGEKRADSCSHITTNRFPRCV